METWAPRQKCFIVQRSHRHQQCATLQAPHIWGTWRDRRGTPHVSGLWDRVVNGELMEWPQLTVDKVAPADHNGRHFSSRLFWDFVLGIVSRTIQAKLCLLYPRALWVKHFQSQLTFLCLYIRTCAFVYHILKMKMTSMCCCGTLALACFLNVRLIIVFRKSHCCAFPQTIYFIVKETLTCMVHPIWCK